MGVRGNVGRIRCLARIVVLVAALPPLVALPPLIMLRSVPSETVPMTEPEQLQVGFTFSPRQARYLNLPWRETFRAALALSPELVRLGAYWDEIEPRPGHYDFSILDGLLDDAAAHNVQVILTVGMKSPRWPEYHLPRWLERRIRPEGSQISADPGLRKHTLRFLEQVVRRYEDRPVITYWQVENEPLDPAGHHGWQIEVDFLREEVDLLRRLDDGRRPIIINLFVETDPLMLLPSRRKELEERAQAILDLADILGLDIYPSRGMRMLGRDIYFNWEHWIWERLVIDLQQRARQAGKEAWIMEAQAEPWEPSLVVYTDPRPSPSLQPQMAAGTFERLQAAGFRHILFWGVEHWYMRRQRHQDQTWWERLGAFFPRSEVSAKVAEPAAREAPPDDPGGVREPS